jgi:glycosyltransferase involved in cell wall biosynthesis
MARLNKMEVAGWLDIVHVITGLNTGGAETALCRLLESMGTSDFHHTVIALGGEGALSGRVRAAGAKVAHLNMSPRKPSLSGFWRLRQMLHREQPDVVQGWMYHANVAAAVAAFGHPAALLWGVRASLHDYESYPWNTRTAVRMGRALSAKPWAIIYNSRVSCAQHSSYGYATGNIRVIPNGIDCSKFAPNPAAGVRVRRELAIADDALVIGLVARYDPMKDHEGFLHAASRLIERCGKVRFVLVGRNVNDKNPALRCLVTELGLGKYVDMLGERVDCSDLMNAFDIVSTSSYGEAFPNVVAEAMACAVPCAVTDVGDSADVVGDTGYVVPPRNPDALSEAWLSLIQEGHVRRKARGLASRRRVNRFYAIENTARAYRDVYFEACGQKLSG